MEAKQTISRNPLGDYAEMGYHLKELDDHITEVLFKDSHVNYFNQSGAQPEALQKACRNHWDRLIMAEAY